MKNKKLISDTTEIAEPKNGKETKKFVLDAYNQVSPSFISLKSDPDLSKSITGEKK